MTNTKNQQQWQSPVDDSAIAVIGVAGRFPQARNLREFWQNINSKRDCISEFPASRASWEERRQIPLPKMGVLEDMDCFDPLFFNISPAEARAMDPQQRLMLQEAWHCFEDAAIDPASLRRRRCGVFIGCGVSNYWRMANAGSLGAQDLMGNANSILAGRIAYYFDFTGPCLAIDTACSSSLVAVAEACESLLAGTSDIALAGGVCVIPEPSFLIMAADAGMLSPTGHCYSFDQRADGFVPAEGVGAVLLKKLSAALRDGDRIQTVIRGWAINQDGKTNGITAPSLQSQVAVQKAVYQRFTIDPASISLVEAHGTGTKLGDPIEIKALNRSFADATGSEHFCAVSSVKSNIGHAMAAAGIAGLIKLLLAFKHRTLPPNGGFETTNEHLPLKASPFFINKESTPWIMAEGNVRRAAISSFGFSGTNAHLVVEEFIGPARTNVTGEQQNRPRLCILSAKTEEQLKVVQQTALQFLLDHADVDPVDLAYTLQVGRQAFEKRMAILFSSPNDLIASLRKLSADTIDDNTFVGNAKNITKQRSSPVLEAVIDSGGEQDWRNLADYWVAGGTVDWNKIYAGQQPKKLCLPLYPFKAQRFWYEIAVSHERHSSLAQLKLELPCSELVPEQRVAAISLTGTTDVKDSETLAAESLNGLVLQLLMAQLAKTDLVKFAASGSDKPSNWHEFISDQNAKPYFSRWLAQTVRYLDVTGMIDDGAVRAALQAYSDFDEEAAWRRWAQLEQHAEPVAQAQLQLLENCLRHIADILRGNMDPAEALFPKGDFRLVTNIYANNPIAHYFNTSVAQTVAAVVESGACSGKDEPWRILEIGAGTGSTSTEVLQVLDALNAPVAEYCFTDISQGFLSQAKRELGTTHCYFSARRLDIEREPRVQGFNTASYDIVIAVNVLHATASIADTLRHAQSLLNAGGLLIVVELSEDNLFSHLTFGLLDGWWRYTDEALRIPGCPALTEATWRQLLQDAGYIATSFPIADSQHYGQQLFIGENGDAVAVAVDPPLVESTAKKNQRVPVTAVNEATPSAGSEAQAITKAIVEVISRELQIESHLLKPDVPLDEYGIDSIVALKLAEDLSATLNLALPTTALVDYNTIAKLARFLADTLGCNGSVAEAPLQPVPMEDAWTHEAIAIVGMSAQFPQARSVAAFWRNVIAGRDCVTAMSPERRELIRWPVNEEALIYGGFLDGIDEFDPLFFRISPKEAPKLDPQQRLLITHIWRAVEHAGFSMPEFARSDTGLFVACAGSGYQKWLSAHDPLAITSVSPSLIPNRISYLFDFKGPSEYVDTACSSTLVALHRAVNALRSGECQQALVGGVNLLLDRDTHVGLQSAGYLSADNTTLSFQPSASGFVRSEAVGAVVLMPLSRALAENCTVYALVKGSGVAHGGRSLSLTTPAAEGMRKAIQRSLNSAGVAASSISYVETHGIASTIADSVELNTLKQAYGDPPIDDNIPSEHGVCRLGNLKSVMGHSELASGLAAVIKVTFALRNHCMPAIARFGGLSAEASLSDSRLAMCTENHIWPSIAGYPKRAAVNSFGFGGTNAHIVMEEFVVESPSAADDDGREIIILSAQSLPQLRELATSVLTFLEHEGDGNEERLQNIAYTLQRGRTEYDVRLALLTDSVTDLQDSLRLFLAEELREEDGKKRWPTMAFGRIESGPVSRFDSDIAHLTGPSRESNFEQLLRDLERWVSGVPLSWDAWWKERAVTRIALPGYPLRRDRYWIDNGSDAVPLYSAVGQISKLEQTIDLAGDTLAKATRERGQSIRDILVQLVCRLLELKPEQLYGDRPLEEYGLQSYDRMQLTSALIRLYGDCVDAATVVYHPTIDTLAAYLEDSAVASEEQCGSEEGHHRDNVYPLSQTQQGMWFVQQLDRDSYTYNVGVHLSIKGQCDRDALLSAVRRLAGYQTILKTTLLDGGDGEVLQRIEEEVDIDFDSCFVDGRSEQETQALMLRELRIPFDLINGPLFRLRVYQLPDDRWYLLFAVHHIIADGSSCQIAAELLLYLYWSDLRREKLTLPTLATTYRDYVAWQSRYLSGPAGRRLRQYWQTVFARPLPALALPQDRYNLGRGDRQECLTRFELSNEIVDGLKRVAQESKTTLFTVLLSGLSILFYRYSQQQDIVIGTTVAGRNRPGLDALVGCFINMLPIRVSVDEDITAGELIARVKGSVNGALAHQDYPYRLMLKEFAPLGDRFQENLFQVDFSFHDWYGNGSSLNGQPEQYRRMRDELQIEELQLPNQALLMDLTFDVFNKGDHLAAVVKFDANVFSAAAIERMLEHYRTVLSSLLANTAIPIGRLDILSAKEKQSIAEHFCSPKTGAFEDGLFLTQFQQQVRANPDRLAVSYQEQSLSYGELDRRANCLANVLIGRGVGSGSVVGIYLGKSLHLVVAVVAIMKTRAAFLPIDTKIPPNRVAAMVEDSGCSTVLFEGDSLESDAMAANNKSIAIDGINTIDVGDMHSDARSYDDPQLMPRASDLAYVIYTSGSTGQPKGVKISQKNLAAVISAYRITYGVDREPVTLLQLANPGFDVFCGDLARTLPNGGRLVICPDLARLDSAALYALIVRHQINFFESTPALVVPLLDYMMDNELPGARLKTIIVGADTFPLSDYRRLKHWCDGNAVDLYNTYGVTEATIESSYFREWPETKTVPIGRALPGAQLFVLNGHRQIQPIGVTGELYIGGDLVSDGYLNDDALTKAKFISNPLENYHGILYRTGDLARYLSDGTVELIGREDNQIKIRGHRIELGEIEARLAQHELVESCVVVGRSHPGGDKYLIAYYVADRVVDHAGDGARQNTLSRYLRDLLPEYMVPTTFVRLEALPLTDNGKVDRRALPEPALDLFDDKEFVVPRTDTEQALSSIWSQLLNLERDKISADANFFSLGGHSLLIMKMIARLRERGLRVNAGDVISNATLSALAHVIDQSHADIDTEFRVPPNDIPDDCDAICPEMLSLVNLSQAEIDAIVARTPGGARNIQDIYPLAPLQEGILFHHLLSRDHDPYVLQALFSVVNRAQLNKFLAALQWVVNRHDVLRTAVISEGISQPVQVVYRQVAIITDQFELDPTRDPVVQLKALLNEPQTLELAVAPLLRLKLARDPHSSKWFVLWQVHHLITDHVGLEIIQAEVIAFLTGKTAQLAVPTAYREFVSRARHRAASIDAQSYFDKTLADVSEPTTPFNLLNVRGDGSDIEECRQPLPRSLAQSIRRAARAHKVSPAALFHVAWAMVVAACSNRDDVVFGTVLSGRLQNSGGAEQMLGMFINTLPIRVKLEKKSVRQVLQATEQALRELIRYEQTPLSLAQNCSGVGGDRPLFSAVLNYRHSSMELSSGKMADQAFGVELLGGQERSNYPLTVSVDDWGTEFSVEVQSDRTVSARRVISYLETAAAGFATALLDDPARSVSSLSLLPDIERRLLLEEWSTADTSQSRSNDEIEQIEAEQESLLKLFETQVAQTPNNIAVVFNGVRLSYAELNAKANQLARYLKAENIGRNTLVGICMERCTDLLVAIFGILKFGAAYVPIDPHYPIQRVEYMLKDSGIGIVVTQSYLLDRLSGHCKKPLCLDVDSDGSSRSPVLSRLPDENVSGGGEYPGPDDLFYVIYTSGSTGRPKGVGVSHRGVNNLLHWYGKELGLTEADRILVLSSFSFDLTQKNFFASLLVGGQLHLAGEPFDPDEIVETLQRDNITAINLTPSAFYPLVDAGVRKGLTLPALRHVILGGEPIQNSRLRLLPSLCPNVVVMNSYGPTECSDVAMFYRLENESLSAERNCSCIGRPICDTQIYVLDQQRRLVPPGIEGEIGIGGVGVAHGYINNDELTASKFIRNPFGGDSNDRLYLTGDRARWRPDGNLEYLGRVDEQVKVRGFRIELGEVEAQLLSHATVQGAVVIAKDEKLIAYIVKEPGSEQPDDVNYLNGLRANLREILPEFMVPSAFVILDKLPLTPSGKINRKVLPDPDREAFTGAAYSAPQTETERALTAIWSELLHLNTGDISVTVSFFALGGHSLLAMQLLAKIQAEFTTRVSLQDLLTRSTVRELAQVLDGTYSTLTPVNDNLIKLKDGTSLPLFMLHPISGEPFAYLPLSQVINDDIPVYAIQSDDLSGEACRGMSLETLAAGYVSVIRGVQPRGPYRLIGWSLGGLIAYEMARQLLEAGHTVEYLGLVDSGLAHEPVLQFEQAAPTDYRIKALLACVRIRDVSSIKKIENRLRRCASVEEALRYCQHEDLLPSDVTCQQILWRLDTIIRLAEMAVRYVPESLRCPVHFYHASHSGSLQESLGWPSHLTTHWRTHELSGDHYSVIQTPAVGVLAELINKILLQNDNSRSSRDNRAAEVVN